MALADTAIRNAKPRDKDCNLADSGGLYLLITPAGGKLWRLKFRIDGKERKLALGRYPEISLAEARKQRDAARSQMAQGADPTRDLRGALTAPTVTHYGAITEAAKVGQLLRTIDDYDGGGITTLALQLAPHAFVRPGELRHAEWDEIDLDGALWIIPAGKMKMRKPHHVPLSRQAVALFREVQALTGPRGYVCPSVRTRARPMSENTLNAALRRPARK